MVGGVLIVAIVKGRVRCAPPTNSDVSPIEKKKKKNCVWDEFKKSGWKARTFKWQINIGQNVNSVRLAENAMEFPWRRKIENDWQKKKGKVYNFLEKSFGWQKKSSS